MKISNEFKLCMMNYFYGKYSNTEVGRQAFENWLKEVKKYEK